MSATSGWETKRLDVVSEIVSGSTPATHISEFWNGEIVWITPYDLSRLNSPYLVDSAKKITPIGLAGSSTHLLPPKSLVISSRAPIGYLALPIVDFCTNQGCKSLKLKPEIDPVFAYYNVAFNMDKIKNLGEGTTFSEISKAALSTIEMDFPVSLSEQSKIAEILSTVDRAIEQTEALIAKQQRIKTGLMQDLLTRGIDEHGQLRTEQTHAFKDSPLGRIPVEWVVSPAEDLCLAVIDCKNRTPPMTKDGHPVIRTPNVRHGEFVFDGLAWTDEKSYEVWVARGKPQIGDVVITREAPYGEACQIPSTIPAPCLGQRMMMYQSNPAMLRSDYLVFVLYSEAVQTRLFELAGGSTVGHIKVGDIRRLPIPHPVNVAEQELIASTLSKTSTDLKKLVAQKDKFTSVKTALMQDLLTGRKRVTDLLEPAAA